MAWQRRSQKETLKRIAQEFVLEAFDRRGVFSPNVFLTHLQIADRIGMKKTPYLRHQLMLLEEAGILRRAIRNRNRTQSEYLWCLRAEVANESLGGIFEDFCNKVGIK